MQTRMIIQMSATQREEVTYGKDLPQVSVVSPNSECSVEAAGELSDSDEEGSGSGVVR